MAGNTTELVFLTKSPASIIDRPRLKKYVSTIDLNENEGA